jgi:hypothetical protein
MVKQGNEVVKPSAVPTIKPKEYERRKYENESESPEALE